MSGKKIVVLGTFDTKGKEFDYLIKCIRAAGAEVISVNAGIMEEPYFQPDIASEAVAEKGGSDLDYMRRTNDRGFNIEVMMKGAAEIVKELFDAGDAGGIISLGGTAGTTIGTYAMQVLPVGIPKLQVSTVASGDTRPYVGAKDICMMYSVVDIAGLNSISKKIISNAAHAIAGMVMNEAETADDEKTLIGATMFGVTTPCVNKAAAYLEDLGYEVLVFHATGTGGQSMEALVEGGFIKGVLDITTTEWCDELVGGVLNAGPNRLEAAGKKGIPQIVSTGALDMVNFGPMDSVPEKFKDRNLYKHNPTITLMRTTVEENKQLGQIIAEKLNMSTGPCTLFLPLKGVSMIDVEGKPFYGPEEDQALFDSIRQNLNNDVVELVEMDTDINDEAFALAMAKKLHEYLSRQS